MDNLTHSLVGLMLARTGLDRGQTSAAVMMVLAANAPDLDAYAFFTDSVTYIDVHRGWTHSLAFSPLMALVAVAIVRGMQRTRPSAMDWLVSWIAVLSHLLLDWTNVYGVRLLAPFRPDWLHLDINNIVDPIIWGILLLAVIAPALSGLVGSEISSRKRSGPKRTWAWIALLALFAYEGLRWDSHRQVLGRLDAILYDGEPATGVHAFPGLWGWRQWRGLAEGDLFYADLPVDLWQEFDPGAMKIYYKAPETPAILAAKGTRTFRVFGQFNQVPFWRESPVPDGTLVELLDLRFGTPENPGFTASAIVHPDGQVEDPQFSFGAPPVTQP